MCTQTHTHTHGLTVVRQTHTPKHARVNTHLLTAWMKACWRGEDPYSRPCKAVQRLGGVARAEKHNTTHTHRHTQTDRQNKDTSVCWKKKQQLSSLRGTSEENAQPRDLRRLRDQYAFISGPQTCVRRVGVCVNWIICSGAERDASQSERN